MVSPLSQDTWLLVVDLDGQQHLGYVMWSSSKQHVGLVQPFSIEGEESPAGTLYEGAHLKQPR